MTDEIETEIFFCADCLSVGCLDAHARCATCGSDAVDTMERVQQIEWPAPAKEIHAEIVR